MGIMGTWHLWGPHCRTYRNPAPLGTLWQHPWGHRPRWDPRQRPTDTGTPHLRRAHGSTHGIPAALGPPHPPPTPLSGPPPSPLTSGKSQSPPCGRHSPGGAPSEMLRARSSQGPTAAGLTLRARAAQSRSGTRLQENCGVMGEKGGQRGEGTPRTPPPGPDLPFTPIPTPYHVDKGGDEDQDDDEDGGGGAAGAGADDGTGQTLQHGGEQLGWGGGGELR